MNELELYKNLWLTQAKKKYLKEIREFPQGKKLSKQIYEATEDLISTIDEHIFNTVYKKRNTKLTMSEVFKLNCKE